MGAPNMDQARSAVLRDLAAWVGVVQRMVGAPHEPPSNERARLYAELAELQSRGRALAVLSLEFPLAQCAQLLAPSRTIAQARQAGLEVHLRALSQLIAQHDASAPPPPLLEQNRRDAPDAGRSAVPQSPGRTGAPASIPMPPMLTFSRPGGGPSPVPAPGRPLPHTVSDEPPQQQPSILPIAPVIGGSPAAPPKPQPSIPPVAPIVGGRPTASPGPPSPSQVVSGSFGLAATDVNHGLPLPAPRDGNARNSSVPALGSPLPRTGNSVLPSAGPPRPLTSPPAGPVSASPLPARPLTASPVIPPLLDHSAPGPEVRSVPPVTNLPGVPAAPPHIGILSSSDFPATGPGTRVSEGVASAPLSAPSSQKHARPNFAVRTMLGLRAFGRGKSPPAAQSMGAPNTAPPPGRPNSMFGFRPITSAGSPGRGLPPAPPMLVDGSIDGLPPLDPSPGVAGRPSGLPPVAANSGSEVKEIIGRLKTGASSRKPEKAETKPRTRTSRAKPLRPVRRTATDFPWWAPFIGLALMGGLVFGLVKLLKPSGPIAHAPGTSMPSASGEATATSTGAEMPATAGGTSTVTSKSLPLKPIGETITLAECKAYFDATHSGSESPELRELLDSAFPSEGKPQQNSRCAVSGSHACQSIQEVCKLLASSTERARTAARTSTPVWAQRLRLPSFGVRDDSSVKHVFDRYTINPSDHEAFQSMYFKCGSYQETIKAALTRFELPPEIMALVMVESACVPTIESPVGARGLFQLMPAAGRAYHLRVSEEIDERRNPTKATQAGIQYLADAYRKLGDWELTFASYNMGVYGVMARVERLKRAGIAKPTYWDLRENDLLPQETANYVPMIEGFALILLNMRALNFTEDQRPPIVTGDLEVWPGTRLGMIAHAAGTTLNEVKSLNPDIMVPQIPTSITGKFVVQVPRDNVFRARDLYAVLWQEHDETDQCVPDTFPWGSQRVTPKMQNDCRARGVRVSPGQATTGSP